MPIPMPMLDDLIREAYGWLADCGCNTHGMSEQSAVRTVQWNYDGGWRAFVAADQSLDEAVVWLFMVRRFGLEFAKEMFAE
jgi:hypothetical protein